MAGAGVVALAAGEWLRHPAPAPVVLGALAALLVVATTRWGTSSWGERIAGVLALILAATLAVAESWRIRLDRAELISEAEASRAVGLTTARRLDALRSRLAQVARRAASSDLQDPEASFALLERLRGGGRPALAIAVFRDDGALDSWSGRFLSAPSRAGDSLAVIRTPFYVVLELRRHRTDGRVVVASAPIWRDPAIPRAVEALIEPAGRADPAIRLEPVEHAAPGLVRWPETGPVLAIAADQPDRSATVSAHVARHSRTLAWLTLLLLAAAALAGESRTARLLPAGLALVLVLRAPLGQAVWPAAFAPASYFSRALGPLSASAGALAAAGAIAAVAGTVLWYSFRIPARPARALGVLLALVTPYITRELGRGITPPASGVPVSLWLVWHLAVLLPTVALTILACGLIRVGARPGRPALPVIGGLASLAVAAVGLLVFTGRPGWPAWYTLLWVPPILLVTRPAPMRATLVGIALAAGSGSALITWGSALAGRTDLALSDLALLGTEPDPLAQPRLADLGNAVATLGPAIGAPELYRAWRRSELYRERYPIRLMVWEGAAPVVDVMPDAVPLDDTALGALALGAAPGQAVIRVPSGPGVHHVLTRRIDSARVLLVAVAPRSRLIPPATLGRVLEPQRGQLYRLAVTPVVLGDSARSSERWRRERWTLRAARRVLLPAGPHEVNIVIPLGRPEAVVVRGGLLLLGDLAVVLIVWLVGAWVAGEPIQFRFPLLRRSYQTRLALALAVFFVVPAALLTALGIRQLAAEAGQSRDLVMQRILRDAIATPEEPLRETARRLDSSLGLYRDGLLAAASEPVLPALGVLPPLLDAEAWHSLVLEGDPYHADQNDALVRTGYLSLPPRGRSPMVLGTVQSAGDQELGERQLDIAFLFLLASLLGVVAAVGAARFAARMLSRPVDELRLTALALGRGLPAPPRLVEPTREFEPVFDAFSRMAADLRAGQQALEAARRRTESVLATVSTGVVAVDAAGNILLANPTAEEMLGVPLPRGSGLPADLPPSWSALRQALGGDGKVQDLELDAGGRRYAVTLAPLEGVDGWVIALNDVTQTTRAARVLAWADVANQVAHAIKNPLTPLRLGIQHLRRVRERRPEQFDTALDETSERLLAEIDRLDAIARGFSRFAAPAEAGASLEPVPLRQVAEEVATLHHLAPGLAIRVELDPALLGLARRDELKEVLLNLCDNARNAGASRVVLRFGDGALQVRDNGRGIAPEVMPRIFEPRFSTTSSGSGLGLAIVRRVVEGWGGSITVTSAPGSGAEFAIRFAQVQRNSGPVST